MMKKILTLLKNIIYILAGFYIILSPFIFKLLIIRLPKDLYQINLIVAFCTLFLFSFLSIMLVKSILFSLTEDSLITKKFKYYISNPLKQFYTDAITLIDNYVKHELLGPRFLGEPLKYVTICLNKYLTENHLLIVFSAFDILPKVIFIICFILDILYNKQLNYIYYFGVITLLPLIFRYLIYTFKGFALANIKASLNYLCFCNQDYVEVSLEDILQNYITNSFQIIENIPYIGHVTLKQELQSGKDFNETLDFYLDQLYIFTTLYNNTDFLEQLKRLKLYQLFMLTIYSVYSCIWLYLCLILLHIM